MLFQVSDELEKTKRYKTSPLAQDNCQAKNSNILEEIKALDILSKYAHMDKLK